MPSSNMNQCTSITSERIRRESHGACRLFATLSNLLVAFAVLSYAQPGFAHQPRVKIAISKATNSVPSNYIKWLRAANQNIEIVELAGLTPLDADSALKDVDGLLLSGGADVDPAAYKREELRSICDVDEERDVMEFALIKRAREQDLPILGICRGMQILNVAFGGSLVADIPTQYSTKITHTYDNVNRLDSRHEITFVSDSYMIDDIDSLSANVNSAHHQCVNEIALCFRPVAFAQDGIIEAMEWSQDLRATKPFLFAVQWHPERLPYDHPMSLNIAKRFLDEALAHHNRR